MAGLRRRSAEPGRLHRCTGQPGPRARTVLQLSFPPLNPGEYVGLNVQEPQQGPGSGRGYDLRRAQRVLFEVRTPTPGGVRVLFGVGGHVVTLEIPFSTAFASSRSTSPRWA